MESLLEYEALWDCAAAIPGPPPQVGGRPRKYPGWALVLFDGLCTVFTSARRTETNLPFFWPKLRERFSALYPDQPPLPVAPPQRHHWQYGKRLVGQESWAKMRASFRDAAVATALEIGLFDPDGLGSFTHPDRARLIYGDGKVVKPLSKYAPGETWVDERTGEVKLRRADPDAAWYIVGGNEEPRGTKSVDATKPERPTKRGKQVRGLKTSFVMGRSPDPHGRVLLDFDHCPKDEMGFALASVAQMAPRLPGLQGLVWDGAGRGTHASQLGRALGIHLISPITPGLGGHTTDKAAVYKPRRVGTVRVTRPDGAIQETQLYGVQGAAHILEVDSAGAEVLLPAKRLKTERRKNSDGTWRIYNLWQAPDGGTFREPVIDTDDDKLRKLNRAERLRSIPPTDPDYKELYGRRNDAEAQNRMLDDSLWLGRAHSMGAQRHLLDWLGYGLVVNAVARRRSRLARASQQGPQAA